MTTVKKPAPKFIDFAKLSLRKVISTEEKDVASLSWSVRSGYPRITVFTGSFDKEDKSKYDKIIIAPMDYIKTFMFLDYFDKVVASEEEIKYQLDCFNIKFVNNVKTDETYLQSKVIVGKDSNGVIFLALTEENKRKVRFDLVPDDWHRFYKTDGTPETDLRVLSSIYAKSYIFLLKKLLTAEAIKDITNDKETKPVEYTMETKVKLPEPTEASEISLDDLI